MKLESYFDTVPNTRTSSMKTVKILLNFIHRLFPLLYIFPPLRQFIP